MALAAVVEPRKAQEDVIIRRFATSDLQSYGPWLLKRLTGALNLDERSVAGWLNSLIFSREHQLVVQPHSVALAYMSYGDVLSSMPVVHVKFVLAEDKSYASEAVAFYEHFRQWSESLGAQVMVLDELTDVSEDAIKKVLKRVFTKEQTFARV